MAGRLNWPAGEDDSLFAYGTLQFPEVLIELLGRCPRFVPAALPGWRAAVLPGLVYPGLVPAPGVSAPGVVLTGLTAAEWRILDAYEDEQYDLRSVRLDRSRSVWTYAWRAEVGAQTWRPELFAATYLTDFVTRLAREIAGVEAPGDGTA